MSELFYLEMNGIPKDDIYLLPRDAIMQNEEKEKIGYLIGQDWSFWIKCYSFNFSLKCCFFICLHGILNA